MFTESLLQSPARARRGWTTLVSFALQLMAVATLVFLPLFYTQALPGMSTLAPLIGPPPGQAPRTAPTERRTSRQSDSELVGNTVRIPVHIPQRAALIHDTASPGSSADNSWAVPGGTGTRDGASQIASLISAPPNLPVPPPPVAARPVISGGVSQGLLIHQVRPVYPPLAVSAHVHGAVLLDAVITRQGTIENLRVLSGHPMLVRAALEAVQQWRYRPYLLNGVPTDVETQITVNFTLGQ